MAPLSSTNKLISFFALVSLAICLTNLVIFSRHIDVYFKKYRLNSHLISLDSVIKRRKGVIGSETWNILDWDLATVTHDGNGSFDCEMTAFESSVTHKGAEICVHTSSDIYVSDSIRRDKRWMDCNVLPSLWNWSEEHILGADDSTCLPVYLEIGANIGSCVMEMLLETNALILAFEPHPMNLYNLKRSIMNLKKEYRDRIRVIPVGLGNESSTSTIYAPVGNMGNAIIGKKVKDFGKQKWDDNLSFTVNVERLDSIIKSENIRIKLAKMDAQVSQMTCTKSWLHASFSPRSNFAMLTIFLLGIRVQHIGRHGICTCIKD